MRSPGRTIRELGVIGVVLALALGFVVAAVQAEGRRTVRPQTNDGGAWLINASEGVVGHINRGVGEITGVVRFAEPFDDIDTEQSSDAVIAINRSTNIVSVIDQRSFQTIKRVETPSNLQAHLVGTQAILWTTSPLQIWRMPVDELAILDHLDEVEPILTDLSDAMVVVSRFGTTLAITPESQRLVRIPPGSDPDFVELGAAGAEAIALSASGDDAVFTTSIGALMSVAAGTDVVTDPEAMGAVAVLGQPTLPGEPVVGVTPSGTLLSTRLDGTPASDLGDIAGSDPLPPLSHNGCVYAVATQPPSLTQTCDGEVAVTAPLTGSTGASLRARLINGWVWINDLASGAMWVINETAPLDRIDDWGAALGSFDGEGDESDEASDSEVEQRENPDATDAQVVRADELDEDQVNEPPVARPDNATTRTDLPIVVDVLRNDEDPDGDVLLVTEHDAGPDGALVQLTGDHRAIQVTPKAGSTDTIRFSYTVSDGRGGTDSAEVTVSVLDALGTENRPPIAVTDAATVRAGSSVSLNLLENDADPDGDSIILTDVTVPSGNVSFDGGGQITFAPDPSTGEGTIELDYTIADTFGEEAVGTVKIAVRLAGSNTEPDARNDSAVTVAGRPVTLNVLLNDDDPDGDAIRVSGPPTLVSPAGVAGGVDFSLSGDGQLFFTADEAGQFLLRYSISDGSERDEAIIRIDVDPAVDNQPPIAVRDDVTVPRGGTAAVFVLVNDADPDGDVIAIESWSASSAAFENPADPAGVTDPVKIESLRGVGFVVSVGADAPDQVSFRYSVTDGINEPTFGIVVIAVTDATAVDQAPVTTRDVIEVRPNGTTTARVLINDYDPEGGTLRVTDVSDVAGVDTRIGPAGQEIFVSVDAGITAGFTFTYEVTDEGGLTAAEFVDVRLVPDADENRPPVARADSARTRTGTPVDIPVLLNDTDPDGDVIRVESIAAQPPGGSVDINLDGTISYVPDAEFRGTDRFEYVIVDQFGDRDTGDVLVGVIPATIENRPPTAVDDTYEVVAGSDGVVLEVTSNDEDPDGDPLSIVRTSSGPAIAVTDDARSIVFTPAKAIESERVDVTFTYRISDGRGGSDDATVTVTVLQTVQPVAPLALDDTAGPAREGSDVTVAVLANDIDSDGFREELVVTSDDGSGRVDSAGAITFTAGEETSVHPYTITDPDGLSSTAFVTLLVTQNVAPVVRPIIAETAYETPITIDLGTQASDLDDDDLFFVCCDQQRGGSITVESSGPSAMTVVFTPQQEFDGQAGFAYVVDDGRGHEVAASVSITVLPKENGAPTATDALVSIEAGTNATVALASLTDDEDLSTGDTLTYSISAVSGDGITLGGDTVSIVAGFGAAGQQRSFDYTVTDSFGESATANVSVTITESTAPPPIAVADTGKTTQGVATTVNVLANDLDERGEGLRIVAAGTTSAVGSITSSESSPNITFLPSDDFFGTAQISYTIEDARRTANGRSSGTLEIDVVGFPGAPPTPEAVADNATATITWGQTDANGGPIEEFEIESDQGHSDSLDLTNSHTFNGLVNGDEHSFRIRARNEAGWGDWSLWSAPVTPDTLPGRPSAPTVAFADGALDVSWIEPANDGSVITGYDLEIGGGMTANIELGAVTSHTWPQLTNGTNYQFRVRSINAAGLSDVSAWSPVEHPLREPAQAAPIDATQGDRFLDLAWTEPDDNGDPITEYQVAMESDPANPATTTDVGFRWANLPNGDFQRFRVRARNRDNDWSQWSAWSNAERPCGVPMAAGAPNVTRGDGQVGISWTPPDDNGCPISSYTIQAIAGSATLTQTASQFATSHTFSGLTNGTSYTFRIIANNSVGIGDSGAASAAVIPAGPPFAPTGLVADPWNNPNSVFFQFNAPNTNGDAIIRYDLRINGGGIETAPVTAVGSTFPSGIRSGLAPNTTYSLEVRACNSVGCGGWSNTDSATTYGPPSPVTNLVGTGGDLWVRYTWNPPPITGTGQEIQGGFWDGAVAGGLTRSATTSSLYVDSAVLQPNRMTSLSLTVCNDFGCSSSVTADATPYVPVSITIAKTSTSGVGIGTCNTPDCYWLSINASGLSAYTSYTARCHGPGGSQVFSTHTYVTDGAGRFSDSTLCVFGYTGQTVYATVNGTPSNTLVW